MSFVMEDAGSSNSISVQTSAKSSKSKSTSTIQFAPNTYADEVKGFVLTLEKTILKSALKNFRNHYSKKLSLLDGVKTLENLKGEGKIPMSLQIKNQLMLKEDQKDFVQKYNEQKKTLEIASLDLLIHARGAELKSISEKISELRKEIWSITASRINAYFEAFQAELVCTFITDKGSIQNYLYPIFRKIIVQEIDKYEHRTQKKLEFKKRTEELNLLWKMPVAQTL